MARVAARALALARRRVAGRADGAVTGPAAPRRATRATAGRWARITATRAAPHGSLLRGAVGGVLLDLALRALGRGEAAGHRGRLTARRVRRALLDRALAARVDERRVGLLDSAFHVVAVAGRPGTVAVRGDRCPGVRDVALVRIDGGVALGVAGNGAHEHNQERCEQREMDPASRRWDHGGVPLS